MTNKHISDVLEEAFATMTIKSLAQLLTKVDRLNEVTQSMQTQIIDLQDEVDRLKMNKGSHDV